MTRSKVYIKYSRPMQDKFDSPPVLEIYQHGDRPEPSEKDSERLFIYDEDEKGMLSNERSWDGQE
jgi:hypothetical protein